MERECYEKVYYMCEQFKGTPEQIKKYGLERKKASNGLIRFFKGKKRVPVGSWLVHKKFTDKVEVVDEYGFKLRFHRMT